MNTTNNTDNYTDNNIDNNTEIIDPADPGMVPPEEEDMDWDGWGGGITTLLKDLSEQRHSATLYREEIIREICSILISESKPNALLVGPAGCGKTNIAEELAWRIRRKNRHIPSRLAGYKVFALNLSDIVSGCGLVGELERKMKFLIDYLENNDNKAILFLDEAHMLFRGETYKKVAQILKPALSRGRFMVIAATTTQEVKTFDNDPAFNRRFTRVLVDELSREQTEKILKRAVKGMEKHYGVRIRFTDRSARLVVRTADEFCSVGSHRPDNALTLLDRSVATKIMETGPAKKGTVSTIEMDPELIENTAFRLTSGNSMVKVFEEASLRKELAFIRGQEDILEDLIKAIKLYDMHLRPRNKPLTLLFAGPSGVGKTEVARILSSVYMGEKPITLNMSEYQSSASINRIIGAPAGYIGFGSNRELPFDALDTNPYQVILLDEFEKCDRSVQRLFIPVFDDGVMKTNTGKQIDFSKTIIIATANAGFTGKTTGLGFGCSNDKDMTISDLSEYFDVELVNRFSYKFRFHSISRDVYSEIIRDMLKRETENLDPRKLGSKRRSFLSAANNESVVRSLVKGSYNLRSGARPAGAAVTGYLDNMLLSMMDEMRVNMFL